MNAYSPMDQTVIHGSRGNPTLVLSLTLQTRNKTWKWWKGSGTEPNLTHAQQTTVYTLVEGLMESLEPKRTVNAENPSEIKGVSKMHAQCVVARYNFCEDIIIYERIPCVFVYELLVH